MPEGNKLHGDTGVTTEMRDTQQLKIGRHP